MLRRAMQPDEHADTVRLPGAVELCREAADRLGWRFRVLDPEFGYLFEVDDGRRRRVLIGGRSPLNDSVAARLAADKQYTALLLERAGFRVPETVRCLAPGFFRHEEYEARAGIAPGLELAERRGWPLVVKPIRGSHGREVVLVHAAAELARAAERAWQRHGLAVVQTPVPPPDLRLDFLDGEFLLGYERAPIRVTGDGRSTIRQLVGGFDPRFAGDAAWTAARLDSEAWRRQVAERGRGPDTVLPAGEELDLGGTLLNLNTWASGRPVSELPERWLGHGLAAGRVLGLRHFGIDFRGAGLADDPAEAAIVEINSSPLLLQMRALGHAEAAIEAQARVLRAALDGAPEQRDR